MMEEEVKTIHVAQEATANGIMVSIPWVQRQANGAVIARLHISSARHTAGELLLTEQDLTAVDPEERPLRTQVRRFWGYTQLKDVSPAHLQTARFDVGFRADVAATRGVSGLSIAIIRTFRSGEGPRAVGGPWVFQFRIADDGEVAELVRLDAARQEAARQEAAQREAARLERIRLENARQEAARQERMAALRAAQAAEAAAAAPAPAAEPALVSDAEAPAPAIDRGRRPSRFSRPERQSRAEPPIRDEQPVESSAATAAGPELRRAPMLERPIVAAQITNTEPTAPVETVARSVDTAPPNVLSGPSGPDPADSPTDATAEPQAPQPKPVRSRAPRTTVRRPRGTVAGTGANDPSSAGPVGTAGEPGEAH